MIVPRKRQVNFSCLGDKDSVLSINVETLRLLSVFRNKEPWEKYLSSNVVDARRDVVVWILLLIKETTGKLFCPADGCSRKHNSVDKKSVGSIGSVAAVVQKRTAGEVGGSRTVVRHGSRICCTMGFLA